MAATSNSVTLYHQTSKLTALSGGGNNAELLHKAQQVAIFPLFHKLAVPKVVNATSRELHLLACCRDTQSGQCTRMDSLPCPVCNGRIAFNGNQISDFYEKPEDAEGWINGGFFVLSPRAIDYIDHDETPWEQEPLLRLTAAGEVMGFQHFGFWSCMDTLREKHLLEDMWAEGNAPWKIW